MSRRREREPERVWVTAPAAGLECSVCTEVFTDPVTLACGHTFCRGCAVRWFTSPAKRCPAARCPASAKSKPAALPTAYALREVVEALRVYCRFGLREDDRGGWISDAAGCQAQMSLGEVSAHEATCEHALEVCPFAGCGVERRRRDADAHDAAAALAHARGERDARLALEARMRDERDARLDALEESLRCERTARVALEESLRSERTARRMRGAEANVRFSALEARLAAGASGGGGTRPGATVRGKLEGHTAAVTNCDWSPCGSMILTGSFDTTLKLWDVATLQCLATLSGHAEAVRFCAWSSDGVTVASGSKDKTVKLWSVETDSCVATLSGHNNWVDGLAWSPDGRSLASAGGDFRIWDSSARSCLTWLVDPLIVYVSCAWSPDGRVVVIADLGGSVTLFDVATRSYTTVLPLHTGPVMQVAWSPDGLRFASAGSDATMRIAWATATVASVCQQPTLRGHTNHVMSCAWHPAGRRIATCSLDTAVKVWDSRFGNCIQTVTGGANPYNALHALAWSPDGRMLASGGIDKVLTLWDMPA
jgi:WD40 repeat protein